MRYVQWITYHSLSPEFLLNADVNVLHPVLGRNKYFIDEKGKKKKHPSTLRRGKLDENAMMLRIECM